MHNESSQLTPIAPIAHAERVARTTEILRAELASFVEPAALAEMLDLASRAASNASVDEILREMRATVAGILLNRVGAFMLATQNEIDHSERLTRPPAGRNRAAA
jgi:hypothetical protein